MDFLSCQEIVELVTDYLEGSLSADDRARFESHINACRHCRHHLHHMNITLRVVGNLHEESLPPAAMNELIGAFRTWKSTDQ
jgi:anti-sigma factor RsiW